MRVAEFLKVKRYIRVLFPVSRRCLDLLLQFYGNHILLSPPSVRECCIIELAFMAWGIPVNTKRGRGGLVV